VPTLKKTFANFLKLSKNFPDQNATLEEAILHYQRTNEPSSLPFVFCKVYKYLLFCTDKFYSLTDEDKVSFCVEELVKVMKTYDPSKASVHTMLDRYVMNRLNRETESLQYAIRKGNNDTSDYDDVGESVGNYMEDGYNSVELIESLKSMNLTGNELRYCEIIMCHPVDAVKDTDIAKTLGISSAAINYIKSSLSKKINFSVA
jgi:DNA-directed RNA polymerase specialized sigma subunit